MAGKDIIVLSVRELKRLKIVQKVIDKEITQMEAAELLDLCDRQIRRIVKRVREDGDSGVTHRSRGKPSPRAIPEDQKGKILRLYKEKYTGFGPTFAVEKLLEIDTITLSRETLRGWLCEEGLSYKQRRKRPYRRWRERKEHAGEMVQMDGSHHDWLEGRAPKLVLMGYIDDATNNVFAMFYDYEGVMPAMDSFKSYLSKYGIPQSIYVDRHTTYKSNAKPGTEDNLANTKPLSQFERALGEIGVKVIHANSPQGKGRIERLFGTLQDRLVKEMRLNGIKTKEEANKFLKDYLPKHNKKFKQKAAQGVDLHHHSLPKSTELACHGDMPWTASFV
ncbi:MAG: ISNCY family transposase [Candidatus Brocadiales bacterium]